MDSVEPVERLIEHLLTIVNEIVFPAIALWLAYYIRSWLKGTLSPPPYQHEVRLKEPPEGE